MDEGFKAELLLQSPEQTAGIASALASVLSSGDCLLLSGPVGAGKSHFARALIRKLMTDGGDVEEIPSPTFTLVQTYSTASAEVWHADLYRLTSPNEVVELGLLDAMEEAICIIEWPDRLGPDIPVDALSIELQPGSTETERHLFLSSQSTAWATRLRTLSEPGVENV